MLKFAKTLVFCTIAFFSLNATAQEISETDASSSESPAETQQTETVVTNNTESSAAPESDSDAAIIPDSATPSDSPQTNAETAASTDDTAESASDNPMVLTDAQLDKQIREVSTNLDTLKEDTFTTKSRLLLLREEVLQRSVSGSRLLLRHKNDMGGQYELVQIYYAIDRSPVFSKQDPSGDLDDIDDEVLYDHLIAPGAHQLNVLYVYKGKQWGVFKYMKEYTFRVESGYDFNIEEGRAAELVVTADEKGGVFTPYEDRPGVSFDFQQYDLISDTVKGLDTAEANSGN